MPGVRDDIIIKGMVLAGNENYGGMLGAAAYLAKEIQDMGLLKEAEPINKKLHAAYVYFRDGLNDAIDKMQELIDSKLP